MNNTKKKTATVDSFAAYLRRCNMRLTSERIAVVEVISKHTGLFSADELHALIEKEAFPVAVGTVYNTLDLLIDAGLVKCLRLPDRPTALYEVSTPQASHIYFVCQHCGKVREATSAEITRFINTYEFSSFTPMSFALNIYGLCRKCTRKIKAAEAAAKQDT